MPKNLQDKEEILKTVSQLYKEYNLPELKINEKEWDAFFDVLEAHFLANNIMSDYLNALNILVRRAINLSIMDGGKSFTTEHLSRSLIDLSVFNIMYDEVLSVQEEFKEKLEKDSKKYIKK